MEMKKFKHTLLLSVFAIEICAFVGVYIFGTRGVRALKKLQHENAGLEQEIKRIQAQLQVQKKEVDLWRKHAFYKEKIAREQLQMARKNDQIFLVD